MVERLMASGYLDGWHSVSGDGGPVLLLASSAAREWPGADEHWLHSGEGLYGSVCLADDSVQLVETPVGTVVVFGDSETVTYFAADESGVIVIHGNLEPPDLVILQDRLKDEDSVKIGVFELKEGSVCVLDAAAAHSIPENRFAVEPASYAVRVWYMEDATIFKLCRPYGGSSGFTTGAA